MLKSCYFRNETVYLNRCGSGRGKLNINCGKYNPKYFPEFPLEILIYD